MFSLNKFPFNIYLSCLLQGFLFEIKDSFDLLKVCKKDSLHTISLAYLYPESRFWIVGADEKTKDLVKKLGLKNVSFFEGIDEKIPKVDIVILEKECVSQKTFDIAKEKLNEDGILYINYMAVPGGLSACAFWELVRMLVPEKASSEERTKKGIYFLRLLSRRGMIFLRENPYVAKEVEFYLDNPEDFTSKISDQVTPFLFRDIYEEMKKREFSYIGSANIVLNELELSVPPSQVPTFFELTDTAVSETVKDFIRNTREREDLFSKRAPVQNYAQAFQVLKDKVKIFLSIPVTELIRVVPIMGGKIPLKGPVYDRIFQAFEDGKSFLLLEELKDFSEKQVIRALTRILATGEFAISLNEPQDTGWLSDFKEIELVPEINLFLLEESTNKFSQAVLISEVTKGAIQLSLLEAFILAELLKNKDIAEKIKEKLQKYGIKINSEQKEVFLKRKLPFLVKLGIVKQK